MYNELRKFSCSILKQSAIWLSGELLTAIAVGVVSFGLFHHIDLNGEIVKTCHDNMGNLLTVVSIIFGFALTSFLHYVQIADTWRNDPKVQNVAKRIVDWNAWTVICILFLMMYMMVLLIAHNFIKDKIYKDIAYSVLVFLIFYCTLQLVCHTLVIWWNFQKRDILHK